MLRNWELFELKIFKKGGGGSGKIDYPDYMETHHGQMLDHAAADTITSSVVDIMNAALGSSPFTGVDAYDPATPIAAMETALTGFDALLAGIDEPTDWDALFTQAETSLDGVANANIVADVAAFTTEADNRLLATTLPRFRSGMLNINAVVSSAFPVGEAIIESFNDSDIARHSSKLRVFSELERQKLYLEGSSQMMMLLINRYAWEESYMRSVIEQKRIKIVALKEEADTNIDLDESDALWDLKLFQYGNNVLASIGGGVPGGLEKKSTSASMIGGAMTGAVAGAMYGGMKGSVVNPGWGTVIGAFLGAAAGYLGS